MALSKKHRERLQMAAVELHGWKPSPALGFDMEHWGNECGTVVCAAGYLARLPWFQRRGLDGYSYPSPDGARRIGISFGEYTAWDALTEFFGIPENKAHDLFARSGYPPRVTPQMVARRIRDFLKTA